MTVWHRVTVEVLRTRVITRHRMTLTDIFGVKESETYTEKATLVFMENEAEELDAMVDTFRNDSTYIVRLDVTPILPVEATETELRDIRARRDRSKSWQELHQILHKMRQEGMHVAAVVH